MRTLATNGARDIYLGTDGNLVIATGLEACLESCRRAGFVRLGELPYAQTRGAPFLDIMETVDLSLFEFYIRQVLLTVPGVTSVESVEFTMAGETLNYTSQVKTIYGTGTVTNGDI